MGLLIGFFSHAFAARGTLEGPRHDQRIPAPPSLPARHCRVNEHVGVFGAFAPLPLPPLLHVLQHIYDLGRLANLRSFLGPRLVDWFLPTAFHFDATEGYRYRLRAAALASGACVFGATYSVEFAPSLLRWEEAWAKRILELKVEGEGGGDEGRSEG